MNSIRKPLYPGAYETEKYSHQSIQRARLQRIQQVRQQENFIAVNESTAYREAIEERKQAKLEALRTSQLQQRQHELDSNLKLLQGSLVNTGWAHRNAQEKNELLVSKSVLANKARRSRDLIRIQREQHALLIRKEEVARTNAPLLRAHELRDVREQFMLSEREDARSSGEAFRSRSRGASVVTPESSRNNNYWRKEKEAEERGDIVVIKVPQSAESIEQRFPVKVSFGLSSFSSKDGSAVNNKQQCIENTALTYEMVSLKLRWDAVLKEMLLTKRVKLRARKAHIVKRDEKTVSALRTELALLEATDRAGARSHRIKSVAAAIPSPHDVENARVREMFERVFMSTKRDLEVSDVDLSENAPQSYHISSILSSKRKVSSEQEPQQPRLPLSVVSAQLTSEIYAQPPRFVAIAPSSIESNGSERGGGWDNNNDDDDDDVHHHHHHPQHARTDIDSSSNVVEAAWRDEPPQPAKYPSPLPPKQTRETGFSVPNIQVDFSPAQVSLTYFHSLTVRYGCFMSLARIMLVIVADMVWIITD
jgi:hypothetical protein